VAASDPINKPIIKPINPIKKYGKEIFNSLRVKNRRMIATPKIMKKNAKFVS
jgi:hypothetical protein